ncbi:MAG: glycosyl transferase [Steroidobacteraceae bacterium]|jgi:UDP-N-acetylmuramyl pentapeptide phosphotransferase/UDP-N-acetylglucosamine-1-phosphate transferase
MIEIGAVSAAAGATTTVFAAAMSAVLIVLLYPLLKRYALAKPTARSSHRTPTPQGGGIAVIAAMVVAIGVALGLRSFAAALDSPLTSIIAAAVTMACIGAIADIRPLPVAPRLLLQAMIVAGVIYTLPDHVRIIPLLPWWLEQLLLLLGGLWFVNLVNFMDGLDWMTVAEVIPLTASLVVLGQAHALPSYGTIVALALGGAVLGFAYFNRPAAKLFLGDVGSLPIGLLLGWLLLLVAGRGHLVAAMTMPLYYIADATITLMRRLTRGEPVWQSHRTHFYQLATDRGFAVTEVVARVFIVNLGLCALAVMTVIVPGKLSDIVALLGGATLVTCLLVAFAWGKK